MPTESQFAQVPIEKVQAFWNARPCNIRHSAKPVGTPVPELAFVAEANAALV